MIEDAKEQDFEDDNIEDVAINGKGEGMRMSWMALLIIITWTSEIR